MQHLLMYIKTYSYFCRLMACYAQGYKQRRAFIVAQSPMESTARDFWKMVTDRKCGVIVMLCDLVGDGQVASYIILCTMDWNCSVLQ